MSDGLKLLRAITEQGATETLREITPDLFLGDEEDAAYRFVRRHYRLYSELPEVNTIAEETGIRLPRANENALFYVTRCRDRMMFNNVRGPFNSLRDALMNNNPDQAREHISAMATSVRLHSASQDLLTMSELGPQVMEHYESRHIAHELSGITTGWPTIDHDTDGWQPGDLILMVARPGMGKTHLLIHSARMAWMGGRRVLFVSMEMTLKQIALRFYSQHAGVDPNAFRRGQLSHYAMRRVEQAMGEMEGDNRFHLFAGNFKGKRTEEVDALVQELNPDIIFVDGLYLMSPVNTPKYVDRNSKVAYVADELKQLALSRNRPVVASTQFNREAGKGGKSGGLENIAQSDALSQHASVIYGIKLPPNPTMQHIGGAERPVHRMLEALKGREGEATQIAINFKFTPLDFTEVPAHEAETIMTKPSRSGRGESTNMDTML